jgi:hypothetical protein
LIIGEAMRNENVTPRGIPPLTNPMNRGTAEHEQKGVTIPRSAARMLPTTGGSLAMIRFVVATGKKVRSREIARMIVTRRTKILAVS